MTEYPRRTSAASPIPPAPPPPPFPARRAAPPLRYNNAFTKFIIQPFNYAARPPNAPVQHDTTRPPTSIPRIVGPSSSQDATHRTGLEISALDISPAGTHAILAGREILKTILVDGTKCAEEFNLLAAMRQYASHNSVRSRPKDALDIHDVKWSHGGFESLIATAASSGKVVLYDINRPGVELARLHEHPRQVHKVAFNPHHGALLLSGSQDGTTKLWDMRDLKRVVGICPSQYTHNGQSDGVRDVKWSPTDGVEFAFGTDSGIVQRWDYRQPKAPKLKINAHNRTCHAIDWHPDGTHLVSAGSDKTLRVWNFASVVRRQRPAWTLQAPYPVLHVRWRPPCRSSGDQDSRAWQSTHLVTSYDRDHAAVHVWDFRRPNIPFRELLRYNAAPTDLLWHSQDLLWTVGREGVFNQTDIKFAPKPTERRNQQAFAVAPHGELTCMSGEAPLRKKPVLELDKSERDLSSHTPKGLSPEKGSFGRSSIDDSIDEGFLSSSFKKRHTRSGSNRSTKSLSNTPPSYDDLPKIKPLDESLPREQPLSPNQIAARCLTAVSTPNPLLFTLLAHTYISSLPEDRNRCLDLHAITKVLEGNFVQAKRTGLYRVAQSFKVLRQFLVQLPAALALDSPRTLQEVRPPHQPDTSPSSVPPVIEQRRFPAHDRHPKCVDTKSVNAENSSNAATPLAKPLPDRGPALTVSAPTLLDPDKDAVLVLPPSLVEPSIATSMTPSQPDPDLNHRSPPRSNDLEWANRDDKGERPKLLRDWQRQSKTLLNLEPSLPSQDIYILPSLDRHDSNESFPMFSASTDSRKNSVPSSSSSARSRIPLSANASEQPAILTAVGGQSRNNSIGDSQIPSSTNLVGAESFQPSISNLSGVANHGMGTYIKPREVAVLSSDNDEQPSSLTSMSSSPEESRHQSAQFRTAPPADGSLPKRQNVIFAPGSNKDVYPSYDSLMSVPGDTRPSVTRGSFPTKEGHSPNRFMSSFGDSSKLPSITSVSESWGSDPSVAGVVLSQLMSYHTNQCPDAQTASHIILLLTPPLLGKVFTSGSEQQVFQQKVIYSNEPSTDEAQEMVHVYQKKLGQIGISLLQMESIMIAYHDQLISLRLYNTATQLRRLCFPLYPSIYQEFQAGPIVVAFASLVNRAAPFAGLNVHPSRLRRP
ncbi:MAG: hypothetical protein Q9165_004201 [Trypethelium subeluteriae]